MRVENAEIKITIPIPINKPDCNGVVYTKEAIENAVNNLRTNLPIVFKAELSDDERVVGVTTGSSHIVTWDFENQVCKMTIEGVMFYSGAEIFIHEIEGNKVSSFEIATIGLTM